MNIVDLTSLKIHKLTKAQYEREKSAGNLDETALYLTPDTGDGIPTKVSDLENDSGFITSAALPTKVSQLENDSSFATTGALSGHTGNTDIHVTAAQKTAWNKVSEKANNSDLTDHTGNTTVHITATERNAWNGKANASDIPTKVGQLTNDSGYITGVNVVESNDGNGNITITIGG